MSPDNFNNISRNEVGALHTMDLAATAAAGSDANKEAKDKKEEADKKAKEAEAATQNDTAGTTDDTATKDKKTNKTESQAAASTKAASTRTDDSSEEMPPAMIVRGNKGVFKATVFKANEVAFAKFESVEDVEGRECELCKLKAIPLQSSIDKLSDLSRELQAIADGKLDAKKSASSSPSKSKEKGKLDPADLDRAALSEIAKTCKSKDRGDRLNCHADNLVKLSQKLDDSAEAKKAVQLYFDLYLLTSLNENFKAPTTDWMTMKVDVSRLSSAEDISLRLLSDLNEDNSSYVIQRLTKLKAGSYSSQANNAREMYMMAQNEKRSNDMTMVTRGYMHERMAINALSPQTLNSWLMTDTNAWNEALISGDKEDMKGFVQQNLYTPVQGMIGQLSAVNLFAPNTANGQTQQGPAMQLAQIAIPDLSEIGGAMVPAPAGSTNSTLPALPGSPGSTTASALANRFNATVRGAGLAQFSTTWMTATPQPSPMLNPTSAPGNFGAPSTIPGQGAVQQPVFPQTVATGGVPGTLVNSNPGATPGRGR